AVSIGMTVPIADAANLTFMPDENWNGQTAFNYHSVDNDGLADATPATVTITIDAVNDAPETDDLATSGNEDTLITVPALSGSDLDGQVVSFVIDSLPANGTLMLNGEAVSIGMTVPVADAANLTFMPDENWNGETTFDYYSVDNDGLADTTPATVTITIDAVNDAPETDNLATSGNEDTLITVPALSGSDLDGQVVSFVIDSLPANGTLMLNGGAVSIGMTVPIADAANLTFMPDENWNGQTAFNYNSVDNDGLADTTPATVTITVDPVNDVPETDNLATSGNEDTLITVPALSGSDLDGQVVSFVIDSLPANGTLMLNGEAVSIGMTVPIADAANLTFMPDENWNGQTTFDYHSVDNDGLADTTPATVTITVDPVNDVPEITNIDPARVSEEGLLYGIEDDNTGDADTTNEVSTSGIISFTDVDSSSFDVLVSDPVGLTSGGDPVDVWERDGNTWTGSTQNGLLVMTIIIGEVEGTSPDYTVGYQITLNANIDHPSNSDEDILQFNLGVTINDMLGNSIPSELQVTIEDDSPIDEVDESAELSILNAIGQSISGDLFAPGADGIGEVVFTVETAGLKYNGEYLSYSMSGNTLTATAKIDELTTIDVFTLTAVQDLDGHYDYQFNLLQEIQLESTISYDVSGAPANSKGTYFVHSDGSISAGDPTPGLTVIAEITGTGSQSKINSNNAGIGVDDNVSIGNGEAVRFDYVNGGTSSALISLGVGNNDTRDGTSYFYYKVTYQNAGVVEFTDQSFVGTQDLEIIAPIGDTILAIEIFYDNTHDDDPNNPGEAFQVFAVSSNTIVTELPIGVEFSYIATDGDNDSVIFADDPDDGHFTIVVEPSETMQLATMSADSSSPKGLIVNESTDPSTGIEILIGTNGSDTIDLGNDTDPDIAIWEVGAADGNTDIIINFDINNDMLDLSDILVDEQSGNLEDYLNITFDAVNGDTIITIDANGDGSGFDDLTIILQDTNVNLSDLTTMNNLLGQNPLVVDTIP
ncbi:tandem-95 repeat protein, partial [Shewanella algidipiscicola]